MFLNSMESPLSIEYIHIYILIILELILGLEIKKIVGPTGSTRSQCSWEAFNFDRS